MHFVELYADLATRLTRNRTELRLAEKRSKRDVEWSDDNVRELEVYQLNTVAGRRTPGEELARDDRPHLRIDNTEQDAGVVAEQVLAWLDGTRLPGGTSGRAASGPTRRP